MNQTTCVAFALLLGLVSGVAFGGALTEVEYSGQPLQYTKAGVVDGCGVRLVGMTKPAPGQKTVSVLDVSFNVTNPGAGLVKGGLVTIPVQAVIAGDMAKKVEVPIRSLWLKAAGKAATTPINGKAIPSTTHRHALMYPTRLEPVLDLIAAMQQGQAIQVGFHLTAKDMEEVFFGKVHLSDAETEQFAQCFTEWSAALEQRLLEAPKN
ncbi:MAG: hypothetical protein RIQ60_1908 [Pseudomonadota bacterium]|jgi:hypothetical protein